jgi:hypothetical protein
MAREGQSKLTGRYYCRDGPDPTSQEDHNPTEEEVKHTHRGGPFNRVKVIICRLHNVEVVIVAERDNDPNDNGTT